MSKENVVSEAFVVILKCDVRTSIAFVSTKCSRAEAQNHLTTEKEKICFANSLLFLFICIVIFRLCRSDIFATQK